LREARRRDSERVSTGEKVIVRITYYYLDRGMDIDNLAKPICDALNDFIYDDDEQIVELLVRKRRLNDRLTIAEMSQVLEEALAAGEEFVHVLVDIFRSEGRRDD
jgi:hypothetical protein